MTDEKVIAIRGHNYGYAILKYPIPEGSMVNVDTVLDCVSKLCTLIDGRVIEQGSDCAADGFEAYKGDQSGIEDLFNDLAKQLSYKTPIAVGGGENE